MTTILIYGLVFLGFFAAVEAVKRFMGFRAEDTRKVVHMGSSLITASMAFWATQLAVYVLATGFIFLLVITKANNWFTSLQGVKRKTIGEFTFALSTIIAAWGLLPEHPMAFAFGFIILAVSDTSAQFVGEHLPVKTYRIFGQQKSMGGAIAFFATSLVLFLITLNQLGVSLSPEQWGLLIIALTGLTAIEVLLTYGLDNTFIPLAAGYILWVLSV